MLWQRAIADFFDFFGSELSLIFSFCDSEPSLIFSCYGSELALIFLIFWQRAFADFLAASSLEGSEFAGGPRRNETDKVLGCAPYKANETYRNSIQKLKTHPVSFEKKKRKTHQNVYNSL